MHLRAYLFRSSRAARCFRLVVILAQLAPLTTCATLRFAAPSLELEAVEVTGLSLSGGALNLRLVVYNPNGYDLRTLRVEAELELEDTYFGTATLQESVTLAARSRSELEIPFTFSWAGVGAGARALLERGAVGYRLQTRLRLSTSLGQRDVSLGRSGEVAVEDLVR